MKPSRPEVVSGVRSPGRAARMRPASRMALTSLPVAKPGWTSTPWTVTIASAALKVSSWTSPGLRAVQRVRARGAEALDVEQRRPLADLLVRREADPQRRPRELRIGREERDGGHDLGDAGLVVRAEQRVAAARDEVVAHARRQLGHALGIEHRAAAREGERTAVVATVHDRLDARAGRVRATSTWARDRRPARPAPCPAAWP